ncbi:hypothetical protein AAGG74_18205 [Bacillus mexicanus]|uniref:hypothetical protein n=1 Tax=Bacillus mexicanus TaxID=2834415 RepID=UPI003D263DA8
MKKDEILKEVIFRYLRNEPIAEKDIAEYDYDFFRTVLREFGTWNRMEIDFGFKAKHRKERDKYFLYMMMKERKKRFGIEALKYKNIEDEIKEKITYHFKTVKNLTRDILEGWSKEKVLFEAHTYHLTGGTPENLSENKTLYKNIIEFFDSEDKFYQEYEKHFFINPLKMPVELGEARKIDVADSTTLGRQMHNEVREKDTQKIDETDNVGSDFSAQMANEVGKTETPKIQAVNNTAFDLNEQINNEVGKKDTKNELSNTVSYDLDTLVAFGFMEPEQAEMVKKAAKMPLKDIVFFIMQMDYGVSNEALSKENAIMWLAIKKRFGDLETAKKEILGENYNIKQI